MQPAKNASKQASAASVVISIGCALSEEIKMWKQLPKEHREKRHNNICRVGEKNVLWAWWQEINVASYSQWQFETNILISVNATVI